MHKTGTEKLKQSFKGYRNGLFQSSPPMASSSTPSEGWVTRAKARLFHRKHGQQLVAQWQQRQLRVNLFGVARHTERADGIYAFWNGQRWTSSDDCRRWPLDPPLSDEGLRAAQELGCRVQRYALEQGTAVQVVISSPYFRCIQTAVLICKALGSSARLLIDWSLGEVYGPSVMGEQEPEEPSRGMDSTTAFCRAHGVNCETRAIGEWPRWPETLQTARRRYATRFLSFLQKSAKTQRNFVLVAHGDSVGVALSMMPSLLNQSVERVEYGGMLLGRRRTRGAAVQSMNCYSVVPMAADLDGSHPDEEAAIDKPNAMHGTWTADDACCVCPSLGEPNNPGLPPNPPKASEGWEVELHDITMRRRQVAAKFQRRVQTLAKQGLFMQDRVQQLLGSMDGKSFSAEDVSLPGPASAFEALPTSVSTTTYLFGASDELNFVRSEVQSDSRSLSRSTTPTLEELAQRECIGSTDNGACTFGPVCCSALDSGHSDSSQEGVALRARRSLPEPGDAESSRERRQPQYGSGWQQVLSVQGIAEHSAKEWTAERAEMADSKPWRVARRGSSRRQRQPRLVADDERAVGACLQLVGAGISAAAPVEEGLHDLAEKDSEQLPAGDPKPVTFQSFRASALMKRRLDSRAVIQSQSDQAASY